MTCPDEILHLVERFTLNLEAYRSGKYNETQLRREFLDPFFSALGWDVENKQGYAEAYKDVIHEDAIKVGGATKAPDYCFRIGGTRKFFVEAKRPSANLKDEISPAYQLRRYAWSAKLPLSILTDFDEFAVYDCRAKPGKADTAATARTLYVEFKEYPERWEEIASIFSRDAVLKGSFDKYAESTKAKKGTAEVDDAFLKEIEAWRDALARTIALRNTELTQRQLNFAVQRTIDRMIFLRICEDRGIETYGALMALLNGEHVYKRLCELFHRADEKYNSGLFHFRQEKDRLEEPDELTLGLSIDDKPLKEIIRNLYYPDSPYEFSVLPADILGQVYEQFLGKVIRLTAGHRAVVEDKPEVKKAGGVYYTPTYIVDYIVKNTVGALLNPQGRHPSLQSHPELVSGSKERMPKPLNDPETSSGQGRHDRKPLTPKDVSKLRILDPACGSGSFLIGAYQYLLDWHRDWYVNDDPKKWATGRSPVLFQVTGGDWRLTTTERKRILLNNIYGVDIDPQAVEVTKLSLLLKVLEGENEQTISQQLKMFHERALPDLGSNIKCGNSLIGPDFYEGKQLSLMDDEERLRINVFDWKKEFPEIFKARGPARRSPDAVDRDAGGFDAVIGNPPYVRQEELGEAKAYYESHYKTYRPTADLYVNFVERGLGLLKPTGLFAIIVSNKWLRASYGQRLREYLVKDCSVLQIVDLAGLPVFENATVRTIVMVASAKRGGPSVFRYMAPVTLGDFRSIRSGEDLQRNVDEKGIDLAVKLLSPEGWSLSGAKVQNILQRITATTLPLARYVKGETFRGIITGLNKAFIIDHKLREQLIREDKNSREIIKPLLVGKDVRRYSIDFNKRYLIWTYVGVPIKRYPAILKHFKQFQKELEKRWDQGNEWWELRACDYYDKFQQPKIIYPDIATNCRFTLDRDGYFSSNTTYFIGGDDLYLLAILNSRLGQFYFKQVCAGLETSGTTYLRFFGQYLEEFPVHPINFSDCTDKSHHNRMVEMVEEMLTLHKQLASAKTEHEKTALQRQIDATDRQIDQIVYELYGLTEEEIKIVERDTNKE
jgi:type I restriction-modification system DNA methylase subunit